MSSSRRPSSVVSETRSFSGLSATSDTSCNRHHQRSLIVFCQDCGVALCDSCLSSGDHRLHKYLSLSEACKKRMEALMNNLKELSKNMKKAGNFTANTSSRKRLDNIEDNFLKSKDQLETLFKELRNMLETNKKQAFKLLEAHHAVMSEKINGDNKQHDIAVIRRRLEELRNQTQQNPDSVLKEILEQERRIETIEKALVNQQENPKFDDLRLKSLENSVHAVLQKTKACLPYPWEFAEFITFDKNTADKKLTVSDDKRRVFAKDWPTTRRLNTSPNNQFTVRAEQSFTTGQHYWEVDVRGCQNWLMGVEVDPDKQGERSQQSWMLESDAGILSKVHNDDRNPVNEQDLSFLGVFIDCDKGRLRFYNVATDVAMATFAFQCGRTMRPVFHIIPEEGKSSCLVLCDICEIPQPSSAPRVAAPASMADSSSGSPNDPPLHDSPQSP